MTTMKTRKLQSVSQIEIVTREEGAPDSDTFDIVWTTGFKGVQFDWDLGRYLEELVVSDEACDLSRLNNGAAPFLVQHAGHVMAVAGVITKSWLKDGKGYATVKPSQRTDMQEIIRDIKGGILRNISVGYNVTTYQDVTMPGDDMRSLRAVKWMPLEASIVAIGFDPNAQTSVRSQGEEQPNITEVIMPPEAAPKPTPTIVRTTDPETKPTPAAPAAEPEVPASGGEPGEGAEAAIEQERTRSIGIAGAVAAAGLGAEVATDLIARSVSMEDASREIFRLAEEAKTKPKPQSKEREMTKRELVEAALLNRVDAKRFKVERENPFKQKPILSMFESIIERKAGEPDVSYLKRAVTVSSDLAELLSNVANKLMGKESIEKFAFARVATNQSLKDFKSTPIILLSGVNLAAKTEGGDYADVTLVDSEETIQLEERGILIRLSAKAIINDDLSALKALPLRAQTAGARDIEKRFFAMLALNSGLGPILKDTKALFHADHLNSITTGLQPTVEGVSAANEKMAAFVDGSGDYMDLRTKYILCGPDLEVIAKKTASASLVPNSANEVNPYAGELEVVVSSRVPANVWYAIADKADINPLIYGTLEGMAEPNVETEVDFKSSNLMTKIEYPNCVGVGTHKGIVKTTYVAPPPEG